MDDNTALRSERKNLIMAHKTKLETVEREAKERVSHISIGSHVV